MSTKSNSQPYRRLLNLAVLMALGCGALAPASASAAVLYWACGSNTWITSTSCWSTTSGGAVVPFFQPASGDSVFLTQADAANRSVSFQGPTPSVPLNSLSIDATGTGTMTLSQIYLYSPLTTVTETVGSNGTGVHTQLAAANTASSLYLGANSGSNGTYNLGGNSLISGTLSGNFEFVGYSGTGTFNQTRGTNTANSLYLGANSGGNGTYNLSAGSLSANTEVIGSGGSGAFNQSGGTNTVGNQLYLGYLGGSSGAYNLSGAGSLSANNETIGRSGAGTFTQTGGTNTVGSLSLGYMNGSTGTYTQTGGMTNTANNIYLGYNSGSNGSYNLSSGSLSAGEEFVAVSGSEFIGYSGTGTFTQNGGTNTANNIYLGYNSGSNGSYTLSSGSLSARAAEHIGRYGAGAFTQSGGTHTVRNSLYIGEFSNGTYNLSGTGSLSAHTEIIGSFVTGTFTQNGGTNTANNIYLGYNTGSNGTYTQSGGTNTVTYKLSLGHNSSGSNGAYNLSAGNLSAGFETIGSLGTGAFNQSGGTNTVSQGLYLGESGTGTYNLSAGNLSAVNEYVGYNGTGVFTQSGGTNTAYSLILGLYAGSSGTYNLQGGQLTASFINTMYAGTDIFNFTGGTLAVGQFTGNLVNNGGTLAPGNSPGMTNITGNYTQTALGTYAVEIGGLLAGTQYDTLNVTGTTFLDGLLNVSLFDLGSGLFAPHAGDYFDILTASTIMGSFSSMSFAALSDPNLFWQINYLTDAIGTTDVVRLSVAQAYTPATPVPEPETYAMFLAGLGLVGFMARRRKNLTA